MGGRKEGKNGSEKGKKKGEKGKIGKKRKMGEEAPGI